MKKSFQRVIATLNLFQGKQSLTIFLLAAFFALCGCGDDGSSSPSAKGLPAEVADKAELETYECSMDVIGEKVYVTELEENYECDGEKWFKSYDQTKPSSTESSSGKNPDGSSDEGGDENSPDSEKGSSSSVAPSDGASSESKNGDLSSSSRDNVNSSGTNLSSSSVASSSSVKSSGSIASSSSVSVVDPATVVMGTLTDDRDGQVYKTVTIGTQTWMAQNLNYAYTGVPYKFSSYTGSDSSSWCYNNAPDGCAKYGRLYTWSAVMDSAAQFSENAGTKCGYGMTCTPNSPHRGICPEGWHVPTNEEYSTLYANIGRTSPVGKKLRSTTGWYGSYNGSDDYGFSVLPAGYRDFNGLFALERFNAYLWSASEYKFYNAGIQRFNYDIYQVLQNEDNKGQGRSLRCLQD